MAKKSSILERKLYNYSIATGALLAAANINAQVVDQTHNYVLDTDLETFNVTFNGQTKFIITLDTHLVPLIYGLRINPQSANASFLSTAGVSPDPKALNTGYVISNGKSFNHATQFFAQYYKSYFVSGTDFAGATKHIGVKFQLSGNTHYGWIKITCDSKFASNTIVSSAYETTVDQGIEAGSTTSLPVELTTFQGLLNGNSVALNWETATEVNNYGFDVERKSGGNGEWEKIGFIQGNGTTNSPKQYSFTDSNLPDADAVLYRLKQIDNDGTVTYSKIVTVDLTTITDVDEEVKYEFSLEQNYPNPFNPSTTIKFTIPPKEKSETANVKLDVFNSLGEKVATLLNKPLSAGLHQVDFNASNLPSGIYIYKINIGNEFSSNKKMLLIK